MFRVLTSIEVKVVVFTSLALHFYFPPNVHSALKFSDSLHTYYTTFISLPELYEDLRKFSWVVLKID